MKPSKKSGKKKSGNTERFHQKIADYRNVACDSMIFSYYFHATTVYVNLVEIIFNRVAEKKLTLYTSVISYLETLSYPKLEKDLDKLSFIKSFFLTQDSLLLISLSAQLAEQAADFRRTYNLSTPNAIQYATAMATNSPVFITNDEHFKKVEKKETPPVVFLDKFIND